MTALAAGMVAARLLRCAAAHRLCQASMVRHAAGPTGGPAVPARRCPANQAAGML